MARYYFYILQVYNIIISVARMANKLPNLIPQAFAYIFPGDDCLFITSLALWMILALSFMHGWNGVAVPSFFNFYTGSHVSAVISVVSSSNFCEWEPPDIVSNRRHHRIIHRHFILEDLNLCWHWINVILSYRDSCYIGTLLTYFRVLENGMFT